MAAMVAQCPAAPWKLTQRLQEVDNVEQDPEVEPEGEEMGDIHIPEALGNSQPLAADDFQILPPELRSSPSYCPGQHQQQQQQHSACASASASGEALHGRRSLQQLIQYFDRPGPAVPVDSTLGGFSVVRHSDTLEPSTPVHSEILDPAPLPAPLLPPPPPPLQRVADGLEVSPGSVSFAVDQPQVWDIVALATDVGTEQQLLMELDRKAERAGRSFTDSSSREVSSQQRVEPVLPAPPREAPWWQATQRRHSIAAPTASKTVGGSAFSHHCLGGGLGNLQRSQSIFDLPEPGLALFAPNGSVTPPVRAVLQPPRGLDLEKISAGLHPPHGLLNPFMGPPPSQAARWPSVDYSSTTPRTSLANPGCALQGSMMSPSYFGSFSMAQHGTVDYRRMAMQ